MNFEIVKNKTVAVTGASGSVGAEIIRLLLEKSDVKSVLAIDSNESELFNLEANHADDNRLDVLLCNLMSERNFDSILTGIDIVIHAAAYKHVPLCEASPSLAVDNNLVALNQLLRGVEKAGVKTFIFTSSDKAVNPTNVMGATKLIGERLTVNMATGTKTPTRFIVSRFGNVVGTRGSVIPLFIDQIKKGGPVTITHRDMTRFLMSLEESAELVISGIGSAIGGEIRVSQMPVVRIWDLAEVLVEVFGDPKVNKIVEVGIRPGEKLYEELSTEEETSRSFVYENEILVLPQGYKTMLDDKGNNKFNAILENCERMEQTFDSHSMEALSKKEIRALLEKWNIV